MPTDKERSREVFKIRKDGLKTKCRSPKHRAFRTQKAETVSTSVTIRERKGGEGECG